MGPLQFFTGEKELTSVQKFHLYISFFLNDMKDYLTHVFKNETSRGGMNEKLDHWFDSYENFHKKYIIMPSM